MSLRKLAKPDARVGWPGRGGSFGIRGLVAGGDPSARTRRAAALGRPGLAGIAAALLLLAAWHDAHAGTLARILETKRIKVGVVVGWPRFLVFDPQTRRHEGFLADDLRKFEELTGIKVDYVNATWPGLIAGLQSGQYDAIMGGLTITPERALAVAFTEPYAYWFTCALVRPDTRATSLAALDQPGRTMTVVAGTAMQAYARRVVKRARVTAFPDSATAILEVMQGRAVAYIGDSFTNNVRVQERPTELRIVPFEYEEMEWGGLSHAVRYSDLDLLAFLDAYIRAMKLRNWYAELTARYNLPPETATGPR